MWWVLFSMLWECVHRFMCSYLGCCHCYCCCCCCCRCRRACVFYYLIFRENCITVNNNYTMATAMIHEHVLYLLFSWCLRIYLLGYVLCSDSINVYVFWCVNARLCALVQSLSLFLESVWFNTIEYIELSPLSLCLMAYGAKMK